MTKTIALKQSSASTTERTHSARHWRLLRLLGIGLLGLLTLIVTLASGLVVVSLFFVTAVPTWLAAILALAEVGILIALFRLQTSAVTLVGAIAGLIGIAGLAIFASQHFASTPPITDENGNVIPGSVAELEKVELGGTEQWVTIRGYNKDKPVLLFLAGGPGGSELVMTRQYLGELEKHFVVVNWDQPGTGKSYGAADFDTLTPQRYVDDGHELTLYLRERFDEEKIYLFGESWGSILGIWLVQEYPELYHAFISTGQMVAPVENDIQGYEFAIEYLTEKGRHAEADKLRSNGPPPYNQDELLDKFWAVNGVLNEYMNAHAHGEGVNHNLMFDSLAAQEYGLLDKANWLRGLYEVFTTVYPQLEDVDFRTQATTLEVPVYFVKGRWDVNAVNSLTEEYFELLEAPHKELIWFEDSAHTPMWDEPDHFVDVMVNTVLAQTMPAEETS